MRALFLAAVIVSGALLPSSSMMAHAAEETAQAAKETEGDRVETLDDYKKKLEAHREAQRLELKDHAEAAHADRWDIWMNIVVPLVLFLVFVIPIFYFYNRFVRKLSGKLNDEQTRR